MYSQHSNISYSSTNHILGGPYGAWEWAYMTAILNTVFTHWMG